MTGLVVHEWVARAGGSENVVEAALQALAPADLYCLWNDDPIRFANEQTSQSWLSATPLRRNKALALPFTIPTWHRTRVKKEYEWMFVSSHSFAHHVRIPGQKSIPKFVYVHSPARYIWEPQLDNRGKGKSIATVAPIFRQIDRFAAQNDYSSKLAANSQYVRDRIQRTWGRESKVIYPPVSACKIIQAGDWAAKLSEVERLQLESLPKTFLLGASRLVGYKKLDQVIEAGVTADMPVVIVGAGPDESILMQLADSVKVPVHFVGAVSSAMLYALYQKCYAFVFPAIEDFGIMPVEALAAGTPVIGLAKGGVAESVTHGSTGYLIHNFSDQSEIREAISFVGSVSRSACRERAAKFDISIFQAEVVRWVLGEAQ